MFTEINTSQIDIHSVAIVRNGNLITEAYADPYTRQSKQGIYSVTKSIISALIGLAIQEDTIKNVDERIVDLLTDTSFDNEDEEKRSITIKHLLTMTSGLNWPELTGAYYGDNNIIFKMSNSPNWVDFIRDQPMLAPPGQLFNYSSGNSHLLSAIITKSTGIPTQDYAAKKLFLPLGINDLQWDSDPQGIANGGFGLKMKTLDLARFGLLYLNNGKWAHNKQLLSPDWIKQSTQILAGGEYGYQWRISADGDYYARGFRGQYIFISPSNNLLAVFTSDLNLNDELLPYQLFTRYVKKSVKSSSPLQGNITAKDTYNNALTHFQTPDLLSTDLPDKAMQISGATYQFEPNEYGYQELSFNFDEKSNEGLYTLHIQGGPTLVQTFGLDGRYRTQDNNSLKGFWKEDSFVLNEKYSGVPFTYTSTFSFNKDGIQLDFSSSEGQSFSLSGKKKS
ncbi:serine hydrolase domain-containing protein [Paenibacillus psychroresistens]|nr:serine hydrolase [Paenibacillus psychroresistens]